MSHESLPELPVAAPVSSRSFWRGLAVLIGVVLLLFAAGLLPKLRRAARLKAAAAAEGGATLRVDLVKPQPVVDDQPLILPGSIEPLRETIVHARASGYLRRFRVDIGDTVAAGQILAELDTPEVDQELRQAEAALAQTETAIEQARANRALSRVTTARYEKLAPTGVASQQEVEQHRTETAVSEANVRAAEAAASSSRANVQRLREVKRFSIVVAPFAGTVTDRTTELGALVAAGGAGLYKISATDPVRVFLRVPQSQATVVHAGQRVSLAVREFPGRKFEGVVTRNAGALDPASRTLLTELQIPNSKHELLAGMYAQATISLPSSHRLLRVPAAALINDALGTRVAKVMSDRRVKMQTVTIERDEGTSVLISVGLEPEDEVVANPGGNIGDGALVEPRTTEKGKM